MTRSDRENALLPQVMDIDWKEIAINLAGYAQHAKNCTSQDPYEDRLRYVCDCGADTLYKRFEEACKQQSRTPIAQVEQHDGHTLLEEAKELEGRWEAPEARKVLSLLIRYMESQLPPQGEPL